MDARDRYLAVFDDDARKKLDRVPTFVQYIRDEFILQHKDELFPKNKEPLLNHQYFEAPRVLGFDAVFAGFPSSVTFRTIRVEDDKGNKFRINESGQATRKKSEYYAGGHIHSLEILDNLRANLKRVDRSEEIKRILSYYEKFAPVIFSVLQVAGIFDRVWQAMGMSIFSRHFRKRTKLYRELIKFYAEILRTNIEGLIEATGGRGKLVNILDDVAFKGQPMISPERWEQDFLPVYKEINSIISDAGMIPQKHSDGDVTKLIPSLQKAGFLGLQGWEGGADPLHINDHFPDFVVIGFGDVSDILPFGTLERVDDHVKQLMDALKENRHFVLAPSTVIFKEIPLENVRAFMNAAKKYGNY